MSRTLLILAALAVHSSHARLTRETRRSILDAAKANVHNIDHRVAVSSSSAYHRRTEAAESSTTRGLMNTRGGWASTYREEDNSNSNNNSNNVNNINSNNNKKRGGKGKNMSMSGKGGKSSSKGEYYYYTEPEVDEEECQFVFKYDSVIAFQVENGGVIVDYEQIQDPDGEFITICNGSHCAGEPKQVVGIVQGECTQDFEDVLEFVIATDEEPPSVDESFEIYCPDITWEGNGECRAIDTITGSPLLPPPEVLIRGPEVSIEGIAFNSLVNCRIVCNPRIIV